MEKKNLFLVTISQGEWEDRTVELDSQWSKEEDAIKRKVILDKQFELEQKRFNICNDCPKNKISSRFDDKPEYSDDQLKEILEYCKKHNNIVPTFDEWWECEQEKPYVETADVTIGKSPDIDNKDLLQC